VKDLKITKRLLLKKLLEILKNHFLSSARFRSVCQPHYIAKKR